MHGIHTTDRSIMKCMGFTQQIDLAKSIMKLVRVSSRIFCLGGKIVCKDQLCVKHAMFLSPFLSINHQCTKNIKPEFLLLDLY